MNDLDKLDRLEKFVVRKQIVAVMHSPQRDDPPGRDPYRKYEIVVAECEKDLRRDDVRGMIAEVVGP